MLLFFLGGGDWVEESRFLKSGYWSFYTIASIGIGKEGRGKNFVVYYFYVL
jgi:hypothetical protein